MSWRRRLTSLLPVGVADGLRAARRAAGRLSAPLRPIRPAPTFPAAPGTTVRLLVAPANFAGQGWAWARAAEAHLNGVGATVMSMAGDIYDFPADYRVSRQLYRHPNWQLRQERHVTASFTHVLIEAARPVLGPRHGDDCAGDVAALRRHGLSVALVAHGSDIRLPSRHAEREPDSPFARPADHDELARLERLAQRRGAVFNGFDGPTFVSTPDLLLDAPTAVWLPVVVEPDRWRAERPALDRPIPVVVHAPSNPWLKGSDVIDDVVGELAGRGLVEYRRLTGVPAAQMPAALADADIVIDQLRMGLYGVAACEAMAAGRLVVSYVGDHVREHVRREIGVEPPIVEAAVATLRDVLVRVLDQQGGRDEARQLAASGPEFVRSAHDGRGSAQALGQWLGGNG